MFSAFIALGSNLQQPLFQIQQYLQNLSAEKNISIVRVSSFYRNKPMKAEPPQPDYVNAVAELRTTVSPQDLLQRLLQLEIVQGRVRVLRWGPRVIDCDLLLYENEVINSENFVIPHYDMQHREFVIRPLFEIAPALVLPNGIAVKKLLQQWPVSTLEKMS